MPVDRLRRRAYPTRAPENPRSRLVFMSLPGAPLPFVDLKAQYRLLKNDIDERVLRVLESGAFILGPEVTEVEAALGR